MTVKELIEELKQFDGGMKVMLDFRSGDFAVDSTDWLGENVIVLW